MIGDHRMSRDAAEDVRWRRDQTRLIREEMWTQVTADITRDIEGVMYGLGAAKVGMTPTVAAAFLESLWGLADGVPMSAKRIRERAEELER